MNYPTEQAHPRADARRAVGVRKIERSAEAEAPERDDPILGDWLTWAGIDDCPPDDLTRMAGELFEALDHGIGNPGQRDKIKNFARILNEGRSLSPDQANALRAIHRALDEGPDGITSISNHKMRRRFPGWAGLMGKGPITRTLLEAAKRRDVAAIERIIAAQAGAR